jgi:hypothetical protein
MRKYVQTCPITKKKILCMECRQIKNCRRNALTNNKVNKKLWDDYLGDVLENGYDTPNTMTVNR